MNIEDLLNEYAEEIIDEASRAAASIERYARDGAGPTRRRVETLYRALQEAVLRRDVTGLVVDLKAIAHERGDAGFALAEVDAAIAALEDAILHDALDRLPAYDLAFGYGLVATALAHARAALRAELDPTAPEPPPPCPDLSALFRGTAARPDSRPAAGARPPARQAACRSTTATSSGSSNGLCR